jgi:hypothetical protein
MYRTTCNSVISKRPTVQNVGRNGYKTTQDSDRNGGGSRQGCSPQGVYRRTWRHWMIMMMMTMTMTMTTRNQGPDDERKHERKTRIHWGLLLRRQRSAVWSAQHLPLNRGGFVHVVYVIATITVAVPLLPHMACDRKRDKFMTLSKTVYLTARQTPVWV